jgi:hypothetical protein
MSIRIPYEYCRGHVDKLRAAQEAEEAEEAHDANMYEYTTSKHSDDDRKLASPATCSRAVSMAVLHGRAKAWPRDRAWQTLPTASCNAMCNDVS